MNDNPNIKKQPDLIPAAFFGQCPNCSNRTLFQNLTSFADLCRVCGLRFDQYNVGDGPAAFLTLIVGAIILALALVVELNWHPSLWIHLILWFPLTIVAVVGALRVSKAILLILEHRNQAGEGRIMSDKE